MQNIQTRPEIDKNINENKDDTLKNDIERSSSDNKDLDITNEESNSNINNTEENLIIKNFNNDSYSLDNKREYPLTEYKRVSSIFPLNEKNKNFYKSVNLNANPSDEIQKKNEVKSQNDNNKVNEKINIKSKRGNNTNNKETSNVKTKKNKWYMTVLYIIGLIILSPIVLLCICCLQKYGEEACCDINYDDYDDLFFCCKCCKGCYCKECCRKCCCKRKTKSNNRD